MAEDSKKDWAIGAFVGVALPAVALSGALIVATVLLGAAAIPIWLLAVGLVAVFVKSPIGMALAHRLSDGAPAPAELPEELYLELDDLRTRLERTEQAALTSGETAWSEERARELEDRLDFVERLLTRAQEGSNG